MDYEEKYNNALERAKVIYQGSYKPDTAATIAEILQNVFPELIENEDPKFKESDWITNGKDIVQITIVDTKSGYYRCFEGSHGFGWYVIDIESADKNYHLWTIADAKDGDVLDADAPFIYKKHDKDYVYFYCGVNLADEFIEANEVDIWNNNNKVYPATKEQRELLFSKMKEAGYEWDSDIKKLKKIETIDISFSAKDSELMEAIYFIPEGFHAEIVDNKVIIKKGKQKPTDTYCKENCKGYREIGRCYADGSCKTKRDAEHDTQLTEEDALKRWLHFKNMYK